MPPTDADRARPGDPVLLVHGLWLACPSLALLARLPAPHDGVVAVAETRHPAAWRHETVAASHLGLVLSARAAAAAVAALTARAGTATTPRVSFRHP
ncbi:hypothetical protein [Inmirania thermothiophila]|uniref:Alpha/beta hydrolase family protein n=1 Tax=Inmirania thermothiophila TaxID=1750597 RepID=A0A3N1XT20_9GAMM|nr:hypothetical protein [Inmirania thermothiophila]ROR29804.1 hypothetical protein EDC57_2482 [Inmirania thermothiophila]